MSKGITPNPAAYKDDEHTFTFKLPCGRTIGYAIYGFNAGKQDPSPTTTSPGQTPTVMLVHVVSGSRLEAGYYHKAGQALGIRIVGIDRPGIGLSTSYQDVGIKNPKLLDWPDDVRSLAAHLRLTKYYVLGSVSSTAYTLACAKVIPQDELLGVGLVGGMWPWKKGLSGMSADAKCSWKMMVHTPSTAKKTMEQVTVRVIHENKGVWEDSLPWIMASFPKKDREVWKARPDLWKIIMDSTKEVYRHGTADGVLDGAKLISQPWGFDMKAVKFPGIRLFYGMQDPNMHADKVARYMQGHLPGSTLTVYKTATNLQIIADHSEQVLLELTKPGRFES